ncbi:MAG: hypothetical protein RLZ12_440 [Bacillota bacterium]|jgi:hypothetical protein
MSALICSSGCQPVKNILTATFGTNGPMGDSVPLNTFEAYFTVAQGGEYVTYRGRLTGNFSVDCPGYALIATTERKGLIPVAAQLSVAINDIAAISVLQCCQPSG